MTRSTTLSVTATALALLSPFAANLNNGYVPSPFAVSAFTAPSSLSSLSSRNRPSLYMSSSTTTTTTETSSGSSGNNNNNINYNAVYVAKEGGIGVKSASEMMGSRGNTRSLGAPPSRPPRGGTFVTKGGVTIDAIVRPLRYTHGEYDVCVGLEEDDDDCEGYVSSFFQNSNNGSGEEDSSNGLVWGSDGAIERLVDLLDHRRGALLTSSYEFPGR